MEGFKGRKFFAREPSGSVLPARRRRADYSSFQVSFLGFVD